MTGRMSRAGGWAWVRVAVALSIIAGLLWRVGADAFLAGLRLVTWASVVTAAGLGLVTTLCCAWRWRLVSAGLGVPIPWRRAVGDYYRAQFLNLTLPGGVLGDVHRAVRHGQDAGDVGLGIRAVVLDRFAGQAVQAVIAVAVLCWLPSPVRDHMPVVAAGLLAAGLAALLFARLSPEDAPGRWRRMPRRLAGDVRLGLLAGGVWPGVLLASTVAVAGHLATFVLAARSAGSAAPLPVLLPLTLLALLAMLVPVNLAGWGPREGVAAWAFGAAGLSAAQGVATAVVYGVLAFVASLPGGVVLLARAVRRESTMDTLVAIPRPRPAVLDKGGSRV